MWFYNTNIEKHILIFDNSTVNKFGCNKSVILKNIYKYIFLII